MTGAWDSWTRWTTISPSFSSCHMTSRTSSTRSFWVSIERLSIFCSTHWVAVRASSLESFASCHSEPCPVKRSPHFSCVMSVLLVLGVFLLVEEVLPVLALLVHDVADHVEEVLVDALELLQDARHLPDGVELHRGLQVDLPRGRGGVERGHRDRAAQHLERRVHLRDVGPPVGEVLG